MIRTYFDFDSSEANDLTWKFFLLFPITSVVSIRSYDGVSTHYNDFQGRFLSLFYKNQVDYIKSVRKTLKKKVREAVDSMGPQVFKNFDSKRIIKQDPVTGAYVYLEKKKETKKKEDLRSQLVDKFEKASSMAESVAMTDTYSLNYSQEQELNQAFNVFKDV